MNTMLATAFICLTLFIDTILGSCSFPDNWREQPWFLKYESDNSRDLILVEYSASSKTVSSTRDQDYTTTYRCDAQYSNRGMDYFTSTTNRGQYFCHQTYYYAGFNGFGLLTRKQELSMGLDNAESCPNIIVEYQPAFWEVLVPDTLPDSGINCPLPAGEHDAAFTVPGGTYCANDPSTVTISGDTIQFNLCQPSGYVNRFPASQLPLTSSLKCLSVAPGNFFKDVESSGDVLLLADLSQEPYKFYCARYRTVDGRAYLSLNVGFQPGRDIECESDVSFTWSTAGYMAVEIIVSQITDVVIPSAWQVPTKWHYYYLAGPQEGAVSLSFENQNAYFVSDNPDIGQVAMNTILDSYTSGNRQYFLYMSSEQSTTMCWELTTITPNILMERIASAITGSGSASDCIGSVAGQTQYRVIVKETESPLRQDLPFTEGTYWTIFTEGGSDRDHCRDSPTSISTIAGTIMTTNTCEDHDTYARPYQSTLFGVVAFSSGMIDPTHSQNGDWLLMSRYNEDKRRYEYYCSRYRISRVNNNREIIRLSLNVESDADTICDITINAESNRGPNGEAYRAFLLETTTSSNTLPTTPTTTKGPTTTPSTVDTPSTTTSRPNLCGGCHNGGICESVAGTFRCNCPLHTTGVHCETALPRGECEDGWCHRQNTEKCFDTIPRDYYYCKCRTGFTGQQCNDALCYFDYCENGGTCRLVGAEPECTCMEGFTGDTCSMPVPAATKVEADDLSIIIGLVIGLALLVLAVVIVGVLICQFRNKEREANSPKADGDMMTGGSVQAWYPDYSKDKNGTV